MTTVIKRTSSYAIILAEGHILLSKLARGTNRGKWSLVGGGIKPGESVLDALKREVLEEAGIILDIEPTYLRDFTNLYDYVSLEGEDQILELTGKIHLVNLPTRAPCKMDSDGDSSDGCMWVPVADVSLETCTPFVLQALSLIK